MAVAKDIAKQLGVSVTTVSRALRGKSDIGASTRKKVVKLARDLNYRPNASARALTTGETSPPGR